MTPLNFSVDGDRLVVVASAGGSSRHPAWYLNLIASARAEVEVKGRRTTVAAVPLEQEEAAAWWRRIVELRPEYERYAKATERAFPIVRLVPTG